MPITRHPHDAQSMRSAVDGCAVARWINNRCVMPYGRSSARRGGAALQTLILVCSLAAFLCPASAQPPHEDSETVPTSVRTIVLESGLGLPNGTKLNIAPPLLPREAENAAIAQTIEQLARGLGVAKFTRDSIYAPVHIDIEYVKDDTGQRIGHRIQSAFIAHTGLDQLRDETLMTQLFGNPTLETNTANTSPTNGEQSASRPPPERAVIEQVDAGAAPLQQLNLSLADNQRLARVRIPLLNRVVLSGLMLIESHNGDGWSEIYWMLLEPSPAIGGEQDTALLAGRWIPLESTELGSLEEGEPQPYSGCGGYVAVRQTAHQQVVVETRILLHEPSAWFAGSNTLRAKLPAIMQEQARTFRRQLDRP